MRETSQFSRSQDDDRIEWKKEEEIMIHIGIRKSEKVNNLRSWNGAQKTGSCTGRTANEKNKTLQNREELGLA